MTHAPYNFVPVSRHVFRPPWHREVTQDVPFEEGISGTFEIVVTAETMIFVRGTKDAQGTEHFFRTPDGTFAIPGSTLRGALRNVVELASFGKLGRFNAHRYGVRDLDDVANYRTHMSEEVDGEYVPKVSAGWMTRTDDPENPVQITPCSFARIHYTHLMALGRGRAPAAPAFEPGRAQSARSKYLAWGQGPRSVHVRVMPSRGAARVRGRVGGYGTVQEALLAPPTAPAPATWTSGELVFTGQPMAWAPGTPNRKQHDFVFHDPVGTSLRVSRSVFRDFCFIHRKSGQQHRRVDEPNEEWGYWQKRFQDGDRVPVFFLLDDSGAVRAMGLAMMFRLAYRHSIADAVLQAQPEALSEDPDLADLLFGSTRRTAGMDEGPSEVGWKGRVSIGLCRLVQGGEPGAPGEVVLGAPKPSFHPHYIEQQEGQYGGRPQGAWVTMMNERARVRGWKRYRPQEEAGLHDLPSNVSDSVKTRFVALRFPAEFRGPIRVHNLLPEELGALLWALDFGGTDQARHGLGMAKSMGLGRARIRIEGATLALRDARGQALDGEAIRRCVERFEDLMDRWALEKGVPGGWRASVQVFELLRCAEPLPLGDPNRRHMKLDPRARINDFRTARKNFDVLPPAGGPDAWREWAAAKGRPIPTAPAPARERGAPPAAPQARQPTPVPRPQHQPPSSLRGTTQEVEILRARPSGGFDVRLLTAGQRQGVWTIPPFPSEADLTPGAKVTLYVHADDGRTQLQFKWPQPRR